MISVLLALALHLGNHHGPWGPGGPWGPFGPSVSAVVNTQVIGGVTYQVLPNGQLVAVASPSIVAAPAVAVAGVL